MSVPSERRHRYAYTNTPTPNPNLLLGSAQLLFWLIFHPTAWRNYLKQLEPELSATFALVDLSRSQWRNSELQRMLVQGYIIWPAGVALLGYALLAFLALPGQVIAFGLASSVLGSAIAGIAVGLVVGVAPGMLSGFVAGVAGCIAFSIVLSNTDASVIPILIGAAAGASSDSPMLKLVVESYSVVGCVTFAAATGIVLGIPDNLSRPQPRFSFIRAIGTITIGLIIASTTEAIAIIGAISISGHETAALTNGVVYGLAYGLAVWLRSRRFQWGVFYGSIFGIVIGLCTSISEQLLGGMIGGLVGGTVFALWLSAFFALVYMLGSKLTGSRSGLVVGVIGSSWVCMGGFTAILLFSQPDVSPWRLISASLISLLIGLTINWWRPWVFYPFFAAWHLLLYRADDRGVGQVSNYLRWHAAFWDEHQRMPWAGLDEHLILVLERNPSEGQRALNYLSSGPQRWAAQSAQIELDARFLESRLTLEVIGQSHQRLAAGDMAGPASSLLRSFSRISQDIAAGLHQSSTYNQRLALSLIEDRLDGLQRELIRSNEPYAARFCPIASQWRASVAAYVHELAQAADQRQEILSPYIIGVPLTAQQALFVGRTDIGTRIETMLRDQRCPPLLLFGQRRMGKTSLLNNLGRLLPSTVVPLFVDLQGPTAHATNHAGLLSMFARSMIKSAQEQRDLVLPPLATQDLAIDPFPRFDEWIDTVEHILADRTALLMLDEFEALEQALSEGRFNESAVLGTLRHLIQHRPRFKILLAGSHTLDEVQRWAGYLINVQVVRISYLSEPEARRLIEHPVADFGLRYTADAGQYVYDLTRGHPALVQLLCAEIVAFKNTQLPAQRYLASAEDVEAVVPDVLQRGSFFFADIQHNQVDEQSLSVLRYIAAQGPGAFVQHATLNELFPAQLNRALNILLRGELINVQDGGYGFQVELIRRWFA